MNCGWFLYVPDIEYGLLLRTMIGERLSQHTATEGQRYQHVPLTVSGTSAERLIAKKSARADDDHDCTWVDGSTPFQRRSTIISKNTPIGFRWEGRTRRHNLANPTDTPHVPNFRPLD